MRVESSPSKCEWCHKTITLGLKIFKVEVWWEDPVPPPVSFLSLNPVHEVCIKEIKKKYDNFLAS